MFVKKVLLLTTALFVFIGCDANSLTCDVCDDCYLTVSAPDLEMDDNGYYHMDFISGEIQTFSTLKAETGIPYESVGWTTNVQHLIEYEMYDYWTYPVNTNSYTDDEGIAYTVLGVWEEFVGDTIEVYCGYADNCMIGYLDTLYVIVNP